MKHVVSGGVVAVVALLGARAGHAQSGDAAPGFSLARTDAAIVAGLERARAPAAAPQPSLRRQGEWPPPLALPQDLLGSSRIELGTTVTVWLTGPGAGAVALSFRPRAALFRGVF